ncbi:MAG: hypothetical protein KJ725_00005 [Gammaproteobacteria bacterium]|nr:hypothetical protein [Gammaproteobacteria bacterium]
MKLNKPIKISAENSTHINNILNEINGKATAHTYIAAYQIIELANIAENKLYQLLANKKLMSGARYTARSGKELPRAYKNSRICTHVELECRYSGDWRLVEVSSETGCYKKVNPSLVLTPEQDERAISELRKRYIIQNNGIAVSQLEN